MELVRCIIQFFIDTDSVLRIGYLRHDHQNRHHQHQYHLNHRSHAHHPDHHHYHPAHNHNTDSPVDDMELLPPVFVVGHRFKLTVSSSTSSLITIVIINIITLGMIIISIVIINITSA